MIFSCISSRSAQLTSTKGYCQMILPYYLGIISCLLWQGFSTVESFVPAGQFSMLSTRAFSWHTDTASIITTTSIFAKSGKKKKKPKEGTICVNRQARRNFEILETLEAGISLKGTEVKSIRDGKMNLQDAFVKTSYDGRGCTLMNCHIGKHSHSGAYFQHEERRPRPLLVHSNEARKWKQRSETAGMTIVPLKAYFNSGNKVKLQIALCRGKNIRDKRADIKERDLKRESNRIIKNFRV